MKPRGKGGYVNTKLKPMDKKYEPYGDEWKKALMKLPKQFIVDRASDIGKEKESLQKQVELCNTDQLECEAELQKLREENKELIEKFWKLNQSKDEDIS